MRNLCNRVTRVTRVTRNLFREKRLNFEPDMLNKLCTLSRRFLRNKFRSTGEYGEYRGLPEHKGVPEYRGLPEHRGVPGVQRNTANG
jgi:hypothetical protein